MKTIDWDSLTFANNYVFQEVLKNKELCKYLIERILHIQIKDIRYLIAERHINSARISSKSIRLDVYVEDKSGNVSDIEMQVTGKKSVLYKDVDEKTAIRELPLEVPIMTLDMEIQDMKRRLELRARKKYEAKGRKECAIEIAKDMLADGMDVGKVVNFKSLQFFRQIREHA